MRTSPHPDRAGAHGISHDSSVWPPVGHRRRVPPRVTRVPRRVTLLVGAGCGGSGLWWEQAIVGAGAARDAFPHQPGAIAGSARSHRSPSPANPAAIAGAARSRKRLFPPQPAPGKNRGPSMAGLFRTGLG